MGIILLGLVFLLAVVVGGVGLLFVGPLALIVAVLIVIGGLVYSARASRDLADTAAHEDIDLRGEARRAGDI